MDPAQKFWRNPIETHRKATAARYPILETMMSTRDGAPERWAMEDAHDKGDGLIRNLAAVLAKIGPTPVA